ncbi:hypothetical protein ZIOFF_032516 [Zingiber officinale]|uniref:Plant heme peroxidase family profile domain-containing protein n=1 Tax=Zingiber officinale TaxID=94328 RepID=A0A8J5GMV3_ZINOF|nr:hypothetical protein ZIOFF_032516 [Zingiber officinale]
MEKWEMKGLRWLLLLVVVMVSMETERADAQLWTNFYKSSCPNVEAIVKKAVQDKFKVTLATTATLRLFFHDCIIQTGGPNFPVELSRRDGLTSKASIVHSNLPHPDNDINSIIKFYQGRHLTVNEMVALSGAHTVGFSHCAPVFSRIYDYKNKSGAVDPSMNPAFVRDLQRVCPRNVDPAIAINMDTFTPNNFDNQYYKSLIAGRGLFASDQDLYSSTLTRPMVELFAANQTAFFHAFSVAMVRLGRIGVKTGTEGEIKRDCTTFN